MDFHDLFPPEFQREPTVFIWGKFSIFFLPNLLKDIIITCMIQINENVFLKLSF